jgi:hypothetical protein
MEAGVVIAIITALVSLVIALANAWFTSQRERRAREADRIEKAEERLASAKAELDLVREPLLNAALDLAHRLDNIRNDHFLDTYLTAGGGHRADIARSSTLYRFARYWCVVEDLYDRVALLRFREDESTRLVASTLRDIGRVFASDRHDEGRVMVWREEQRAIAELMRSQDAQVTSLGYATFVERFDSVFARWFSTFADDLDSAAGQSRRFMLVQHQLATLASQLDRDGAYRDQWERLLVPEALKA